jgi:hypothetical protein
MFTAAGNDATTVKGWALLDSHNGNIIVWGPMTTPYALQPGDTPVFPVTSLQITAL